MNDEITLTSVISASYVTHHGGDWLVADAARVSTQHSEGAGERILSARDFGLINTLMKQRHKAPFQHCHATFLVQAPIFVFREWRTHRIAMQQTPDDAFFEFGAFDPDKLAYSEASARYRPLKPVFWIPSNQRPLIDTGGSKMRPRYEPASPQRYANVVERMEIAYRSAWDAYAALLANDIAPEVARAVLGTGVYSSMYCTGNLVSWLHFLSLRTHDDGATFVSYPQAEIEDAARQIETTLTELFPATMDAFNINGRVI